MAKERIRCCVPFCRRTSTRHSDEFLCADHWRLVDRRLKALRTRRLKVIHRRIETYEARLHVAQDALRRGGSDDDVWRWANKAADAAARRRRFLHGIWRRMKAQAIERAAMGGVL